MQDICLIFKEKVYIIDEIQNLGGGTNKAAFHALLKLLEEPPEYIVFIMATTEPQNNSYNNFKMPEI